MWYLSGRETVLAAAVVGADASKLHSRDVDGGNQYLDRQNSSRHLSKDQCHVTGAWTQRTRGSRGWRSRRGTRTTIFDVPSFKLRKLAVGRREIAGTGLPSVCELECEEKGEEGLDSV